MLSMTFSGLTVIGADSPDIPQNQSFYLPTMLVLAFNAISINAKPILPSSFHLILIMSNARPNDS
jgi:hypothetical protein